MATIHVDMGHVLETLNRGIRRADVFLGVGVNAAEHTPPISHVLETQGLHNIQFVPTALSDQEKSHIAEEFGIWIRANGMRDLLETFSVFMLEIYTAVFHLHRITGTSGARAMVMPSRFERRGIADQIQILATGIPVTDDDIHIVRSLNQARNCLAHRSGVVGDLDIDAETGFFTLEWNAFEAQLEEPNGNIIPEAEIIGRTVEEGGVFQLVYARKKLSTGPGQVLAIGKQDLKEICLCVKSIGARLLQETEALAHGKGVLIEAETPATPSP